MTDRDTIRRKVDEYRQDADDYDLKLTNQDLGATKEGRPLDNRLKRIRADADEPKDNSQSEKLDMILSHLDSIHTALADTNARVDAMESGRKDADDDGDENLRAYPGEAEEGRDMPGAPTPLVADRDEKDARRSRKDAAYTAAEEINKPIERSDSARRAASEFQARADKVFQAFGDSAPRYMSGESLTAYKQRLLSKMKKHSQTWAKTDLYRMRDPEALAIAADQIFQDASAYARSPASVPEGLVRCLTEVDRAGRHIQRFYGDPEAVWGMFKQPTRRLVGINKTFAA